MSTTDKDDDLSRAYRAAANEEPPAALDDAIRAAARRAVQARPQAAGKKWVPRWGSPMAAAAVIMLAVSLLFVARQEAPEVVPQIAYISQPKEVPLPAIVPEVRIVEEARKEAAPPPPAKTAMAAPSAAPAAEGERVARAAKDKAIADESARQYNELRKEPPAMLAQGKLEKPAAPTAAAAGAAPAAAPPVYAPAAPPPPMTVTGASADAMQAKDKVYQSEMKALATRQKTADASTQSDVSGVIARYNDARRSDAPAVAAAPMRATPMAAAPMASARRATPPEPAPDWLKRIEELRVQGKLKEAREELVKFRKQYPDVTLPKALAELPPE